MCGPLVSDRTLPGKSASYLDRGKLLKRLDCAREQFVAPASCRRFFGTLHDAKSPAGRRRNQTARDTLHPPRMIEEF
jgi:hypothetical protein